VAVIDQDDILNAIIRQSQRIVDPHTTILLEMTYKLGHSGISTILGMNAIYDVA
jgi:hypothetical protein